LLTVKKDCFELFKRHCKPTISEKTLKKFFDEYFMFHYYTKTMNRNEKRELCKKMGDFACWEFKTNDLPKNDSVYILISEYFPSLEVMESGTWDKYNRKFDKGFYAFLDELEIYFKANRKHLG
jgi:hypothetical protein